MTYTPEDIRLAIRDYVRKKHDKSDAYMEDNWYTDLCLTEFDKCELYEFLEKKFGIKIKYPYFANIGVLCDSVLEAMHEKEYKKQNSFSAKVKKFFQRAK